MSLKKQKLQYDVKKSSSYSPVVATDNTYVSFQIFSLNVSNTYDTEV